MTAATWVLDGVTFYGDDMGVGYFIVESMEGVNDAPPLRQEAIPRPLQDGDFDQPVFRGARLITASGWCRAADEAGLLTLRNQFAGILSSGGLGVFQIHEFGVLRTANVRLYDQPKFATIGDTLSADWSFMLRATDPRLYDGGIGSGHW